MIALRVGECAANGVGVVTFDDANLAIAFLKAVAKLVEPSYFIDLVAKLVGNPDAVASATKLMAACLGSPV